MGSVLFKLFGFGVTPKGILYAILFAVLIFAGWKTADAIKDHFDHITQLEKDNKQLELDKETLKEQFKTAIEANIANEAARKRKEEIDRQNDVIAEDERKAAASRAVDHKEVANVIKNSRPANDSRTAEPVAPVIRDVTDRLWGRGGVDPAAGGQEPERRSNPG